MIPVMEVWPSNRPLASPSSIPATLERYYAVPPAPLPLANTILPQLKMGAFSSAFDSDSSLTELESSDSELSDSDESKASAVTPVSRLQTLRTRNKVKDLQTSRVASQLPLKRSLARISRSATTQKRRKFVKSTNTFVDLRISRKPQRSGKYHSRRVLEEEGGSSSRIHLGIPFDGPTERITRAGLRQLGLDSVKALKEDKIDIARVSSFPSRPATNEEGNLDVDVESLGPAPVSRVGPGRRSGRFGRAIKQEAVAMDAEVQSAIVRADCEVLAFDDISGSATAYPNSDSPSPPQSKYILDAVQSAPSPSAANNAKSPSSGSERTSSLNGSDNVSSPPTSADGFDMLDSVSTASLVEKESSRPSLAPPWKALVPSSSPPSSNLSLKFADPAPRPKPMLGVTVQLPKTLHFKKKWEIANLDSGCSNELKEFLGSRDKLPALPQSGPNFAPPSTSSLSSENFLPPESEVLATNNRYPVHAEIIPDLKRKVMKARPASAPKARVGFTINKDDWILPSPLRMSETGMPPIWCQGRQELCEALPYFRSYQGGHYDLGERCFGYLLDGYPSPMDRCEDNGRVIISHGGGCSDPSPNTPTYQLNANQDRDNLRVRALINCHTSHTPVALIAGKNYRYFPWLKEKDARYAVLGYYLVTHVWAEAEPVERDSSYPAKPVKYFVRYKFRFEWQQSQQEPWFKDLIGGSRSSTFSPVLSTRPLPGEELALAGICALANIEISLSESTNYAHPFDSAASNLEWTRCEMCDVEYTRVYEELISCYNDLCPNFFKVNGVVVHPQTLHFIKPFLQVLQDPVSEKRIPISLLPQALQQDLKVDTDSFTRRAWRAFHCRKCGRLSSRAHWDRLSCATETCDAVNFVGANLFRASSFLERRKLPFLGQGLASTSFGAEVFAGYQGITIHLSHTARIHHLWPVGSEKKRADRSFEEYQAPDAASLFRRNPLTTHRVAGQLLCNQFSFNAGEPYKHCVKVDTVSLEQAPGVVRSARDCLEAATAACIVRPEEASLNEVLSLAYMEGGKMNYHNDGEEGLGPNVASLSLGSTATMSFRPRTKKVKNDSNAIKGSRKNANMIVRLELRHGDITIMEGWDVQKYYEHMVEPAATARFIGPAKNVSLGRGRPKNSAPLSSPTELQALAIPRSGSSRFHPPPNQGEFSAHV